MIIFAIFLVISLIDILSFEGVHASQIVETHTKFSHLENTAQKEEVDGEANLRFLFAVFIVFVFKILKFPIGFV